MFTPLWIKSGEWVVLLPELKLCLDIVFVSLVAENFK